MCFLEGDVVLIGAYCRNGETEAKMRQVAMWTRGGRIPFIMAADFNKPVAELQKMPWLGILKAQIITPKTDGNVTCHQGGGSLIDYFIVSDCLRDYIVEAWGDSKVPNGPHDRICLSIRRSPQAAVERVRIVPKGPLWQGSERLQPIQEPRSWKACVDQADREIEKDMHKGFDEEVIKTSQKLSGGNDAEQLTRDFAIWARADELQAFSAAGLAYNDEEAIKRSGRASVPKFHTRHMRKARRPLPLAGLAPSGLSTTGAWLSTAISMLRKLGKYVWNANEKGENKLRAMVISLAAKPNRVSEAAASLPQKTADYIAIYMSIIKACGTGASQLSIQVAIKTLERISTVVRERDRATMKREWERKVKRMLKEEVGKAHGWTNAANKPHMILQAAGTKSEQEVLEAHSNMWASIWQADDIEAADEALSQRRMAIETSGPAKPVWITRS